MKNTLLQIHYKLRSAYIVIVVSLLWQIIPSLKLVNPKYIPPLSKVLAEAAQLGAGSILVDIINSLIRIIIGFAAATVFTLPLGFILAGAFPRIAKLLNPLIIFLSQIPPFILFPVFVIIFGVGEGGIFTVIFWSATWPILFNTIAGTQSIDPLLIKSALSMGASNVTIFLKVILPGTLPNVMTGMRTAMTVCFMMLIGAETMGASSGLGWEIHQAQRMALIPRIYLVVLVVAVVGLVVNFLFEWLEKNIIIWKDNSAGT